MYIREVVLLVCLATLASLSQAKSLGAPPAAASKNLTVWQPSDGRSMAEWLSCRGIPAPDCDRLNAKKQDLVMALAAKYAPQDEKSMDTSALTGSELDGCILFTEAQVDDIMAILDPSSAESETSESTDRKKRDIIEFLANPAEKWTMPIPYMFDGTEAAYYENIIRSAFQQWSANTCIRFTELPTGTTYTNNYLLLTGDGTGCHSYVGLVPGLIPQQVNLDSSTCLNGLGSAAHEIGHAIGLWHEQTRPDRNNYVQIIWGNIVSSYLAQFFQVNASVSLGVPYGYGSVMHYPSKTGVSGNGQDTMLTINPLFQHNMGQRSGLSFNDIRIANLAYCQHICTNTLPRPCLRDGYQDPNNCNQCKCPDGFSGTYCDQLAPSVNVACGGIIQLVSGTPQVVQSPGYSLGYYYSQEQCSWWIQAPVGFVIKLTFSGNFGIYCNNDACFHWVEVKYMSDLGLEGPRFCCSTLPNVTITSQTNEMMVLFNSVFFYDIFAYQIGFQANIVAVSPNATTSVPPTTTSTTTTTTKPTTTTTATTTTVTSTTKPTTTTTATATTTVTTTTKPTTTTTLSTTATQASTTTTTASLQTTTTPRPVNVVPVASGNSANSVQSDSPAPLWQCSFEPSNTDVLGGMIQDQTDQFDWTVYQPPTPSDPTGPDFAYDGLFYIYIEASAPRLPNDEARLFFPKLNYTGAVCVDFWYHMYGFHINTLNVTLVTGSTEQTIWTRMFDMGNVWNHGMVDAILQPTSTIKLIASRGAEYSGDIGFDKVMVYPGTCS